VEGPKVVSKKRKLERRCMSEYSHTLHDEGRGFNVWASYYENHFKLYSYYRTPCNFSIEELFFVTELVTLHAYISRYTCNNIYVKGKVVPVLN
jgi:hypothetical protein